MAKHEIKEVIEDPGTSEAGFLLRVECPFCGALVNVTVNMDFREAILREGCLAEVAFEALCGKCGGGLSIPMALGLYRKTALTTKAN